MNTTRKRKGKSPTSPAPRAQRAAASEMAPIVSIARQVRGWADTVLGIAVARTRGQKTAIGRAGAVLRRMREAAGLTLEEVARALDLNDPELIANAERGIVALPFELILRLAAVVGRGDPLTSVMKLTRAYNPDPTR